MAVGGWDPEPVFGDALAGSGGMGEPFQPRPSLDAGGLEVFPDALSGVLVAGASDIIMPVVTAPTSGPVAAPAVPRQAPGRGPASRPAQHRSPPARPWPQLSPPGQPAAAPTISPLTRRPSVGYVAVPGAPPPNVSLIRPPAYLPGSAGITQIRSALQQVRQSTAGRSKATASATKVKVSGVWGVLFALLIVLVVTGAAAKIISAISHLLQGT